MVALLVPPSHTFITLHDDHEKKSRKNKYKETTTGTPNKRENFD